MEKNNKGNLSFESKYLHTLKKSDNFELILELQNSKNKEAAYKVAASLALKAAGKKCNPVILEPIMAVEVVAPAEYLGAIMGDLSSRRGMIEGQEERGNAISVQASVPLSEMFGYATDLRSFTQGRGNYTMQFDRYEAVPKSIKEEIIKKNSGNN